MSAGSLQDQLPQTADRAPLRPPLTGARLNGSAPTTVAALCEEFGEVCRSAVDPLEIASALEFEGIGDRAARTRFGSRDVFALAQQMYAQVERCPAEPEPPPDPWPMSRLRPALHGILYALPAVCYPAAAALLAGPGALGTLVLALLVAWGLSQGLASLGYQRLGTAGVGPARSTRRCSCSGWAKPRTCWVPPWRWCSARSGGCWPCWRRACSAAPCSCCSAARSGWSP